MLRRSPANQNQAIMSKPQKAEQFDIAAHLGEPCRYCDKPVVTMAEASVTHSYWQALPFICHKACKDAGIRQEAYDCQVIDADCNDCRHYQRGHLAAKVESLCLRDDGTEYILTHQPNIIIGGRCLKFDRPTTACPNKWSGLECFEHRRAPKL